MNILCFGDSNTWGACPEGGRWPRSTRWPGALQQLLPDDYIIENGLCGRTTVFIDPLMIGRRGVDDITNLLDMHQPLDWIMIMLGTNDTKSFFSADAAVINAGLRTLLDTIRHFPFSVGSMPKLLIIAPAAIGDPIDGCPFVGFDAASVQKSRALVPLFRQTAAEYGAAFLDANTVAHVGSDKIHLDAASHIALAQAIAVELAKHKD